MIEYDSELHNVLIKQLKQDNTKGFCLPDPTIVEYKGIQYLVLTVLDSLITNSLNPKVPKVCFYKIQAMKAPRTSKILFDQLK